MNEIQDTGMLVIYVIKVTTSVIYLHRIFHLMLNFATENPKTIKLTMKRILATMTAGILMGTAALAQPDPVPGKTGNKYVPYMKELGMDNDRYILIDLDNGGKRITAAEAVKGLKPFVKE